MKQKLLAGLTGLFLLASLILPAAAAPRAVPVTVDGALLKSDGRLDSGVTSVPLRALLDALGGWTVSWNRSAGRAEAENGDVFITAVPGEASITVGGVRHETAQSVLLLSGRTYVPLRTLCEALGYGVSWDAAMGGAAVASASSAAVSYSEEDLYWLSRIISAESRGESLRGQIAVGNVVLNRVASSEFPNTIRGVIFDTTDGVQFEPVTLGTVYDAPTELSVTAAKAALIGSDEVGACLYFFAPALSQGTWIRANRTYCTTIGCHRFYL